MEDLIKYFKSNYFTDLISFITAIVTLHYSYKKEIENDLKLLRYYLIAYVIIKVFNYSFFMTSETKLYNRNAGEELYKQIDFFFTVLEFSFFCAYLKPTIPKIITKVNVIVFFICATCLYFYQIFFYQKIAYANTLILFTLQAILLLSMCLAYYISIFKTKPIINLIEEPKFWIATGLTFFMISTLPFSISSYYLIQKSLTLVFNLFSIFFIFYVILFLMMIKAFSCPIKAK
jgi:hypothetical protein